MYIHAHISYTHTYTHIHTQYIYTHVFCVEKCIFLTSVRVKHIFTTEL